jgi:pimeloyl-ACP methyl ester carboxylesterase
MDFQVTNGFHTYNGGRLYWEAAGAGSPVVLIHGMTLDTRMWDDQFPVLAQHHRVIRYDARGFGKSSPLSGHAGHWAATSRHGAAALLRLTE